jgi:hypothetical protein
MKTKWVFVDDDTAIDLILDDEIAAREEQESLTDELENPHYPSGIVPVDTQLKLEFGKWQHSRFLDFFHQDPFVDN